SNNIFTVAAGLYTVYIRDVNGCIKTQSVTVVQPIPVTASISVVDAACNSNGQITAIGSGGVGGPYSYGLIGQQLPSTDTFNVVPGVYNLFVLDANDCPFYYPNIVVGLSNNLSVTGSADVTICEGSSTQLSVTSN